MARPSLRRINYWEKHERRVLEVLVIALRMLLAEAPLKKSEDSINRRLYIHVLDAIRVLYEQGVRFVSYPMYEARNQPVAEDLERSSRESKRPDLQFAYIDHHEPNPSASAKQYVVECKRLGDSGRSDWVLNENYIKYGIIRFRDANFGYAKSQPSGAMIGYIQNMTLESILGEVNETALKNGLPELCLSTDEWLRGDVSQLEHQFERSFEPSSFILRHLWLDLTAV